MKKPQHTQMTEFDKKVQTFSHDYLKCCLYMSHMNDPRHDFTKKLYSKLISSSMLLEDFLDYHGAKNNKTWYFYRELSAAVRHLSLAANFQKHLSNRLIFYDLHDYSDFQKDGEVSLEFLNRTLVNMSPIILEEARLHDIPIPDDQFGADDFPGITTDDLLQYDIDDQDKDLQKKHIVKIASDFLNITTDFDQLKFYEPYSHEDILELVPDKINEVEIRRYEMLLHSLQSSFDTYVIHGGFRYGNRKLKQLRGAFSVTLHLLQGIGRLLHFYERHLHEAGYKNTYKTVRDRLASLINPATLLDLTINYGLFYACHFLTNGQELAREILNEYVERSRIKVGIPQKLGFHARPSLLVAKIVQYYGGPGGAMHW